MAFKLGQKVWRCTAMSMQNAYIPQRCIVIPPNVGEPTRTNQEVIHDLTRAIIGGTFAKIFMLITRRISQCEYLP